MTGVLILCLDVCFPVLAQGVLTRSSEQRVTRKECGFLPARDMCCTAGQARNLFPIQWSGEPTSSHLSSLPFFETLPACAQVLVFSFLEQD